MRNASIALASKHVVRSDIAYHAELRVIELMQAQGLDTSHRERRAQLLKGHLDRMLAWLQSLQRF